MLTEQQELSRRSFLRLTGATLAAASFAGIGAAGFAGCGAAKEARTLAASDPDPQKLTSKVVLVSKDEPGEPLNVSGRIFGHDGKTPLAGALLYVYHTDARGIYNERQTQGGQPDPRIKGWMKTDADGRYEFRTIRPASYPNSRITQHIHSKASADGYPERWIENFLFRDDPFLTDEMRRQHEQPGTFSSVMSVERGADGVLRCVRDIKLERV